MSVSIRFSLTSGAEPTFLPQYAGAMADDAQSSVIDLYITHTSTAKIEDCKLYILPYSAGVYLGERSAQDDYDRVIGYGDTYYGGGATGGLEVNMNHTGGFPAGSWQVFRTGYGDSSSNAITIPATALSVGSGADGEIDSGGEAHIQFRVSIPLGETDVGRYYVDTLMSYSLTS